MIGNTLTACWWMASDFVTYYSLTALFATHLQKDLGLSPALVTTPFLPSISSVSSQWGSGAASATHRSPLGNDHPGWIAVPLAPVYLLTHRFHLDLRRVCRRRVRSAAAACTANYRAIWPSGSPPRCGRRQAPSAITKEQSSAALCRWC